MTCHHRAGDPNCSSTRGGYDDREERRKEQEEHARAIAALKSETPDAERFEIIEVNRIGAHLVMKVQYPNCAKCAYEGNKVMVFLNVSERDVLRWRRIDPHFRDPKASRSPREAPPPAARFPASAEGWADAITYARGKPHEIPK
jgi:hypothetical protein